MPLHINLGRPRRSTGGDWCADRRAIRAGWDCHVAVSGASRAGPGMEQRGHHTQGRHRQGAGDHDHRTMAQALTSLIVDNLFGVRCCCVLLLWVVFHF